MGATEEQMHLVASAGIDHVAYILILYSLAFLTFLFVMMLIWLYDQNANAPQKTASQAANGRVGYSAARRPAEAQLRDAEEFELDGLMSDDEDEESASRRKLLKQETADDDGGLGSPSTIGRNSDRVAH